MVPARGSRPPCLGEPRGPQVGILRHNMEHWADAPSCRSSMLLCCRRWHSWRISSRAWTLRFPCRLSMCPRSQKTLSLSALWTLLRRWRKSWSKCRPSCLLPCSSSALPSRSLTLQFRDMVSLAVEVFKVFSPDRIQQRLWPNRPLTLQFVVVEFLEVNKAFTQEKV